MTMMVIEIEKCANGDDDDGECANDDDGEKY